MIWSRKILVSIIVIGLLVTVCPLSVNACCEKEKRSSRASITINFIELEGIKEAQGFYGQGYGDVVVNSTLADNQNNVNISVDIEPPSGPVEELELVVPLVQSGMFETPLGTWYPFELEGEYKITVSMKSDEASVVTYGPETFNFKNITTLSLDNISMPFSAQALSGEYGKLLHSISMDITNEGNVGWLADGIMVNLSISSGGVFEELLFNGVDINTGQCPQPGETLSFLMSPEFLFLWNPSKEGTFNIEIVLTDLRTSDTTSDDITVVIKNITSLDIDEIVAPSTIIQGERFNIEGMINVTGANCLMTTDVLLEIKDSQGGVLFTNTSIREFDPSQGIGTSRGSASFTVIFSDIVLFDIGTHTILLKIADFAKEDQTSIEVTNADNDAPTLIDQTGQISKIKMGDSVVFKVKFTDTKYTPVAICQLLMDDDPAIDMAEDDTLDDNYTDGKSYHYDWISTAGQHTYKLRVSDGIGASESDEVQFEISNLTGGMGMVSGFIRDENTNDAIVGATITINNLDTENSTEVVTDNEGYYSEIFIYGNYTLKASKASYRTSLLFNFYLSDAGFMVEKDIYLTLEGETPTEKGDLKGYVMIIENGTEKYQGNVWLTLLNTSYYASSENGTGAYEISRIIVGEYTIQVSLHGYKLLEESITIVKGENKKDFTLEKKDAEDNGGEDKCRLRIQVFPRETANVYLNGDPLPLNNTGIYTQKYPVGVNVEIIVTADGYKTKTINVTISLELAKQIITLEKIGSGDDDEPIQYPDKIGPILDENGDGVRDVEIFFTYMNETYQAKTGSKGYAEFPQLFADFPGLNSTIPNGVTIAATKEGWNSISWPQGLDIPIFTEVTGSKVGSEKEKGGKDSWIYIAIAVIVLIVLIFVITFLLKKRGGGDDEDDDDDDDEDDDEDDDDDYSREESPSMGPVGPRGPQITTSKMNTCKQCGTVVPSSTTFCPQCGNNLKTGGVGMIPPSQGSLPCKGCGTPIQQGIMFCPSCGMNTTQQGPAVPQLPQQAAQAPPPEQPRLPPGPTTSESAVDNLLSDATVDGPEPPLPPPPA